MNPKEISKFVDRVWDEEIVPSLIEYIRIPNKSPDFDADWKANGHMDRAAQWIGDWCRGRSIRGLEVELIELEGRTPLIFMEIPGDADSTLLMYGHLDKQPEMEGWREGHGPWEPSLEGDKLYGRGGADDGYSAYASLTAIEALQAQGIPHPRIVILIEGCEESGSYDLPHYIDHLGERIGEPDLVVCLDSGAGDYERLWLTTSLRGYAMGVLSVETLTEGVHSGNAGGIVPETFRIVRSLLERLEDAATGQVRVDALHVEIPEERAAQAQLVADALGNNVHECFPLTAGTSPMGTDLAELVLNRTWRPALAVTGADGLPPLSLAGNVLRPHTRVKISLRIPPTCDPEAAIAAVKETLEKDPPHGAKVSFGNTGCAGGWNAPELADWLAEAVDESSRTFFDRGAVLMGEGGTIPFMGLLGEKFPRAQFVITGVLGPASNAHGPNEFLHIPMGKKITACVAEITARLYDWGKARAGHTE